MSTRLTRDRARARLTYLLKIANDAEFLRMIWCVDRIRSGEIELGLSGLKHVPKNIIEDLQTGKIYIQPWLLEDLVNEVLATPKPKLELPRRLACESYEGFAAVYNALMKVEDAESGFELDRGRNVMHAMPRFAHRQFDWQQGWMNAPQLYRSAYIFGQGECEIWFYENHGITPADLVMFALAAASVFCSALYADQDKFLVPQLQLDRRLINAALKLLCQPLASFRSEATGLRRGMDNIAAKPSMLRRTPIIEIPGGGLSAPLPDLLVERATSGLYLDLVKAPHLRNVVAGRFESYCLDLLNACFNGRARPEYEYGPRGGKIKSPDVILENAGLVELVVECKSTRMVFDVKFSDDWQNKTSRGYSELAKGVYQIWRYHSHIRRNLVPETASKHIIGLVLTLDPWMRMTHQQDEIILGMAKALCANDSEILPEDQIIVGFTHIADLETLVHRTDAAGVLKILRTLAEKAGWGTNELGRDEDVKKVMQPYVFKDRFAAVLPFYGRLGRES